MSADQVEYFTHAVGVVLTLLGLWVAAPGAGTWIWRGFRERAVTLWRWFQPEKPVLATAQATIVATMTVIGTPSVLKGPPPPGSLDFRVSELEERANTNDERVTRLDVRLSETFENLERKLGDEVVELQAVARKLRQQLDRESQRQLAVDGKGLIVAAGGVLITEAAGLADQLSLWIMAPAVVILSVVCLTIATLRTSPDDQPMTIP